MGREPRSDHPSLWGADSGGPVPLGSVPGECHTRCTAQPSDVSLAFFRIIRENPVNTSFGGLRHLTRSGVVAGAVAALVFATGVGAAQAAPAASVSSGTVTAVTAVGAGDPTVDRVFGSDRYATSVEISKRSYPGTAPVVYVATGENYPDALSAGPAAATDGGPLLLTSSGSLPASVSAEIRRLAPSRIIVVGGENAIRPAVYSALQQLQPNIQRIAGADRYDTSRQVSQYGFRERTVDTVYLATGLNFPDALSAAGAGGSVGAPVVLIDGRNDFVDDATFDYLSYENPSTVKFVGGRNVITQSSVDEISEYANTARLAGADRYTTARQVNEDAFGSYDRVFLATGTNFPDALAGSAWAGSSQSPLFTVPGTCIPQDTLASIQRAGATHVTLIGGPNTLSAAVEALTSC